MWQTAGFKTAGTWDEVFGKSTATDEIFEAWNYARYVGHVAEMGKAEYPLPMYVNSALHRSATLADAIGKKEDAETTASGISPWAAPWTTCWTSGEPRRRPSICSRPTLTAPGISSIGAVGTADPVTRCSSPSRAAGRRAPPGCSTPSDTVRSACRYTGWSSTCCGTTVRMSWAGSIRPSRSSCPRSWTTRARKATIASVLLQEEGQREQFRLGDYTMTVAFGNDRRPGGASRPPADRRAGALFVWTGPDEFYVIASNEVELAVTFVPNTPGPPLVGAGVIDEGSFVNGRWVQGRSYVDHRTGNHDAPVLLPAAFHRVDAHSEHNILRVRLYRYQ